MQLAIHLLRIFAFAVYKILVDIHGIIITHKSLEMDFDVTTKQFLCNGKLFITFLSKWIINRKNIAHVQTKQGKCG